MRILLIEDNQGDTRLIREMLFEANGGAAELECEETLTSGLERLGKERFDALLLDLTLPDSQGLETLQKVRPFEQPFPVVVLTGLDDDETAQTAIESGAQDYLVKGKITADMLDRCIRYALGRHAADEALRKSEEHYRRLVENASEVILTTDLDFIVTYASPSVERQTGFTAEEAVGRSVGEFITAESFDVVAGAFADELARQGETDVTPPVPVIIEIEQCRKDGSTYPAETSAGFLRDHDGTPYGVLAVSRNITQRKEAEEALRKSEEHYRLLYDNAGEGIFTHDSELILTDVNRICCEAIGYSREELVGRNIFELRILHPDEAEKGANTLRRLFDGEDRVEAEFTFVRKDGAERLFTLTGGAIRNPEGNLQSVTNICRDVTEERRVGEALRRTQFTVDQNADSVLWVTSKGKIIYANEEACRRHGYTREEMLSLAIFDINVSFTDDNDLWETCVERIQREGHFVIEYNHRTKGGEVFPVEVMLKLFKLEDDWLFIANDRDITERKAADEALLESRADFAKQAQELKDMLAVASHELRHPATIFKGYSHILLNNADNLDSKVARDALVSMDRASDRLAHTVNQLMDASRIESGETSLRFEELKPRTLLNWITAEFGGAGADVVTSDKTGAGAVFNADHEKLRSVLGNLVENAVKFSPDGAPVGVCVEAAPGGFLFSVCDDGPGISEEHAELIFERFYQVAEVEHHSVPGIGLGLYIAKTIVDEHGGWIRCRPGEGGGSVFEFFIPEDGKVEMSLETDHEHVTAQLSPSCEVRPPDETPNDAGLKDSDTRRVLTVAVIDDDPEIVMVNMIILRAKGYEAIAAYSGEEGLEMVGRETPDVVLLDIMMPGLDGFETCRRLKSDERTRDIPVIFVTAKTSEDCYEEAFAAGGSGFLSKPFEPDELFESIEKVCDVVQPVML